MSAGGGFATEAARGGDHERDDEPRRRCRLPPGAAIWPALTAGSTLLSHPVKGPRRSRQHGRPCHAAIMIGLQVHGRRAAMGTSSAKPCIRGLEVGSVHSGYGCSGTHRALSVNHECDHLAAKERRNIAERGLSFGAWRICRARRGWEKADYGETRLGLWPVGPPSARRGITIRGDANTSSAGSEPQRGHVVGKMEKDRSSTPDEENPNGRRRISAPLSSIGRRN
jgi:hypothetical protein